MVENSKCNLNLTSNDLFLFFNIMEKKCDRRFSAPKQAVNALKIHSLEFSQYAKFNYIHNNNPHGKVTKNKKAFTTIFNFSYTFWNC